MQESARVILQRSSENSYPDLLFLSVSSWGFPLAKPTEARGQESRLVQAIQVSLPGTDWGE